MSAAQTLPATVAVGTPFKFLNYYEEADALRFAGREREIVEIANAILSAPTLIVYGKSGLGKTSLMLAGVFPELRRRNCLPVHVRTLQNPIGDLCREVRKHLGGTPPSDAGESELTLLIDSLRRLSDDATVVLVLDQFEEFFIRFRGHREAYDAFVSAIGVITRERDLAVRIVFSLREEYLADLDDFRANVPSLFENEYRLRQLTAFGVRETITRPLEIARVPYDPRLISRLVNRLSRERFDSVMLQIVCQEVFDHALRRSAHDFRLTEADLHDADDIDGIFRRYLDQTAKALPPGQHLQARVVLRCLTTQERTKQALRLSDFATAMYRLEDQEIIAVLDVLERHRLLRVDLRGTERWYELTHERLVPILEEWLRLDPQFNALLAAYDLIVTPTRSGVFKTQPQNLLPAGFLSDVVGPFRERLALGEAEREFLLWSAIYHRHADIAFWATAYGEERSRELVFGKLAATDTVFRRGAAFASARISVGHGPTLERLLEVSLKDRELDVRREAGAALAKIGSESETTSLKAALESPATRRVALETLADRCAQKGDLREFSRWDRFLARRIARARLLRDKRLLLADASRDGALGGLYGALGWTLTVALVYGMLLTFLIAGAETGAKLWIFATCLGVALLGAVVFGALLTSFVTRSVAARMVLTRKTNFARLLWTSRPFLAIPTLWVLGWSGVVAYVSATRSSAMAGDDDAAELLAVTVIPVFYWLLVPLFVRVAQRATLATESVGVLSARVLAASAGLPLLIPGIGFFAGLALDATRTGTFSDVGGVFAALSAAAVPFGSGLTACLSGGLLRMCRNHGSELAAHEATLGAESNSRAATASRWFLSCAALAALAWVLWALGLDAIPFRPSWGTLSDKDVRLEFPTGDSAAEKRLLPRTRYYRFEVAADQGTHVMAQVEHTGSGYGVMIDGVRIWDGRLVLLRVGGHELRTQLGGISTGGGTTKLGYVAGVSETAAGGRGVSGANWETWANVTNPDQLGASVNHREMVVRGRAAPGAQVSVRMLNALRRDDPLRTAFNSANATCATMPRSIEMTQVSLLDPVVLVTAYAECSVSADQNGDWSVTFTLVTHGAHQDAKFSSLVMVSQTP